MAQFNYLNEIKSAGTKLNGPLTRGPLQRWVRHANENLDSDCSVNRSMNKLSLSTTSCNTSAVANASASGRTPTRSEHKKKKTPNKNRTPGRSTTNTPNKSHTPNKADRFIPSRTTSNYELCHYMMGREQDENNPGEGREAGREAMGRALAEAAPAETEGRLLQYTCKAPAAPEGYQNRLRVIYSQAKVPSSVKSNVRYIPQAPDRILDAPDMVDDYYLNLVDWSASNIVGVALGGAVYLWNAATGHIEQLLQLEGGDTVTSLAWVQGGGGHLAVGTSSACVQLWDCERVKRLRSMDGHSGRVGALAWNAHVLSSGARDGRVVHHDVRQRDHALAGLPAHTQEVCGLKWSPDGRHLASGGNDNLLHVWAAAQGQHHSQPNPVHTFTQHQAAVKGLAWCPWSAGILASGGGTADRTVRLWNINTGACLNHVDTKSQVCSILWSTHYKELISAHGYANNQLIIWKYPTMQRVAELTGHAARVLHLAISPDGSTVLSAGADETLRLWKCFMPDPSKKKDISETKAPKSLLSLNSLIR